MDSARAHRDQKGGGNPKLTFKSPLWGREIKVRSWSRYALKRLAELDPRKSRVVELRFWGGLSVEETAEVLQVHPNTVLRDWRLAKTWLKREMSKKEADDA